MCLSVHTWVAFIEKKYNVKALYIAYMASIRTFQYNGASFWLRLFIYWNT